MWAPVNRILDLHGFICRRRLSRGPYWESPTLPLLPPTLKSLLLRAQEAVGRHPGRLTAGVVGLLGSFAITAFGIAPLAPDAALLPKRLVTEEVALGHLDLQLGSLSLQELELHRTDLTRSGDTADTLLGRLGISDLEAARFLRDDRDARRLIDGRGGKMVQVRGAADGTLLEMVVRFPALEPARLSTHFSRLTVSRTQGRFNSRLETAVLVPQNRLGSGTVSSSLWAATDDAKLPDAIASQLIDIFSGDIDFHRELRKGDTFRGYAPYGDFTYETPPTKHACFIATGTGIAPFRAMMMADEYLANPPKSATCLLGIRDEDEGLYEKDITPHGKWIACVSQPKGNWNGFPGRVTDYLRSVGADFPWTETEYYLCGAGQMIDEVRAILTEKGVDKESIHREIYFKEAKPTAT